MADFWIKVEKSTPDKPEIFEIAETLGIDPDAVIGKLIRVWCWLDSNSENGHIKSVTSVLIDRLTFTDGFADAMKTAGWLTDGEVPNFDRHLGENAKKRAKDAERKRKSRDSSKDGHKKSVTEKGLDKSREDKSRVEDNKEGANAKRFTPPTTTMVFEYMKEKGVNDEFLSERFVDYYASKGWMIGKNKMKDWKAAVRTWLTKRKQEQPPQRPQMEESVPVEKPYISPEKRAANIARFQEEKRKMGLL